jgi:hypothetical protein
MSIKGDVMERGTAISLAHCMELQDTMIRRNLLFHNSKSAIHLPKTKDHPTPTPTPSMLFQIRATNYPSP